MATIAVQKEKIERQKGMVILPIKEYQKLLERAVPDVYLVGKEAEDLDKLVKEGLKEYHAGKTIRASSLREALKQHGRRKRD